MSERDEYFKRAVDYFHRGKCALAYDEFTCEAMADFALKQVADYKAEVVKAMDVVEADLQTAPHYETWVRGYRQAIAAIRERLGGEE